MAVVVLLSRDVQLDWVSNLYFFFALWPTGPYTLPTPQAAALKEQSQWSVSVKTFLVSSCYFFSFELLLTKANVANKH